jgi:hypothetical protein
MLRSVYERQEKHEINADWQATLANAKRLVIRVAKPQSPVMEDTGDVF